MFFSAATAQDRGRYAAPGPAQKGLHGVAVDYDTENADMLLESKSAVIR